MAQAAGLPRAIGFDMGGTSTDVSRFDGSYELEYETEKAGVRLVAPMLAIETVAAGGGSICRFDGVKLVVGPDSAGADPGPASYGRGGPLTITDVNFYLGRIPPRHFPFFLSREAVEGRLSEIAAEVAAAGTRLTLGRSGRRIRAVVEHPHGQGHPLDLAGQGIRSTQLHAGSLRRRRRPARLRLAAELKIPRILCHPDAGLLSAYGIGLADVTRHRGRGIYRPLSDCLGELEAVLPRSPPTRPPRSWPKAFRPSGSKFRERLELRYLGVEQTLVVAAPQGADYAAAFAAQHEQLYGYVHLGRPLEVVALRVEVRGRSGQSSPASHPVATARSPSRRNFAHVLRWPLGRGPGLRPCPPDAWRRPRRPGPGRRAVVDHRD